MRIRTSVATTYSSSLLVKSCPPGHRSVAAEAGLFTMKIKQVEEPGMGEELKVHLHVRGKVFMTKEKLTPKQIPHQSFSVPCSFPFPQSGISISLQSCGENSTHCGISVNSSFIKTLSIQGICLSNMFHFISGIAKGRKGIRPA